MASAANGDAGGLTLNIRAHLVTFLILVVAYPAAGASPRTESAPYFLGEGVATNACFTDPANWAGTGGACFALDGSETTVDVTVLDDSGLPVFVTTIFWDGNAATTGFAFGCSGTPGEVLVPTGTTVVEVDVDDPAWNTANALLVTGSPTCAPGVPGTTGTITATFGDAPRPPAEPPGHCMSAVGLIGRDATARAGVDFGVLGCSVAGERADTRWIGPGSDEVVLRHFMDQGVETLAGHVSGLGADADVELHRVVTAQGAVIYESDWTPIDETLDGEIVGTVTLPDGRIATDTYRAFDVAG